MRKESYTFAEYNQEREAVIKESQYKEKYKNALKEIRDIVERKYALHTDWWIIEKTKIIINEVLND